MGEPSLGHEMVRLHSSFYVCFVDPHCHPHEHVLWPLNDVPVIAEEVGAFQSLEAKEVVVEIAIIDDLAVQAHLVLWKRSTPPIARWLTTN